MFLRCIANPRERPSVDGDGDFVSIPTFNYYDQSRFSISMWAATDVCDPNDPTPSIFGYIYSHNQQTSLDANGQIHGGILSVSFHDLAGIWVAFFSRWPAISLLTGRELQHQHLSR